MGVFAPRQKGSSRDARRRFAVVVSRFNEDITGSLLSACVAEFRRRGLPEKNVAVVEVPGAFELPLACARLLDTKKFDAVVALGCVIRGETPHDRYIASSVAQALMNLSVQTRRPVVFGLLTPLNLRQARARAGKNSKNKGLEAAQAAFDMCTALEGV